MKTAYIFHDAFNDSTSDWYPWMKTTLEKMGYVTLVPKFPTPAAQTYESWKGVVKNHIPTFDEETILVGHGVGGTFALRLIEELPQRIRGVFLVASYAEPIGHVGYDRINETFVKHDFNWEKIQQTADIHLVFAGSDDPFVPIAITERLAKNLGETPSIIPGGGHINHASGFTQAVVIAQGIKESLSALDKSIVIEPMVPEEITPPPRSAEAPPLGRGGTELVAPPAKGESLAKGGGGGAIHTMYQDMSKLVNSNQGYVASSLLGKAREVVAEKKERSPLSTKNMLYIAGTIVMILIAIGAMGYVFYQYLPAQQLAVMPKLPSLIPSETVVGIELGQKTFYEIGPSIKQALAEPLVENTIRDIVYLKGSTRTSFLQTLSALEITLPQILTDQFMKSSLNNQPVFMHGVLKMQSDNKHFLVIPFNSYDALFTGMAQWEPNLFHDVGIFLNVPNEFLRNYTLRGVFTDELVNNRQVRVLRYQSPAPLSPETIIESVVPTESVTSDTIPMIAPISEPRSFTISPYVDGDFMVGYFFLNQRTLIIVDDLATIPEIIKRWANRQVSSSDWIMLHYFSHLLDWSDEKRTIQLFQRKIDR